MNIPNMISAVRIILAPLFSLVVLSDMENRMLLGLAIFVLAGISDLLDGIIARKFNQITPLGSVLDPLADKLMLFSVLYSFFRLKLIDAWVLYALGFKEAVMIVLGAVLYISRYKLYIPANRFGKFATISFYVAVIGTVLIPEKVSRELFTAVIVVSAVAALSYAGRLITQIKLIRRTDKR